MVALVCLMLFQMWLLMHLHTSAIRVFLMAAPKEQTSEKPLASGNILQEQMFVCYSVILWTVNTVSIVFFLDDCNPIIFLVSQKTHSADGGNCSFLFSSSVWQGCGITSCQFVDTSMDSTVISWANDSLWKFHQNVWHCPEHCLSLKYIL